MIKQHVRARLFVFLHSTLAIALSLCLSCALCASARARILLNALHAAVVLSVLLPMLAGSVNTVRNWTRRRCRTNRHLRSSSHGSSIGSYLTVLSVNIVLSVVSDGHLQNAAHAPPQHNNKFINDSRKFVFANSNRLPYKFNWKFVFLLSHFSCESRCFALSSKIQAPNTALSTVPSVPVLARGKHKYRD